MNWRLGLLLAFLLGCAAATATVIVTYRAPVDPQVERNHAEWTVHWKRRVNTMIASRRYPEAERAIRNYLRYAPDDGNMRRMLGKALCENGKAADALEVYYVLLLKDPGDFVARNNLGVSLARCHRLAEARRELREAFSSSGGRGFVGFNLSRVHALMGEGDESQRILNQVVSELRRDGEARIPEDAVMLDGFSVPETGEAELSRKEKR